MQLPDLLQQGLVIFVGVALGFEAALNCIKQLRRLCLALVADQPLGLHQALSIGVPAVGSLVLLKVLNGARAKGEGFRQVAPVIQQGGDVAEHFADHGLGGIQHPLESGQGLAQQRLALHELTHGGEIGGQFLHRPERVGIVGIVGAAAPGEFAAAQRDRLTEPLQRGVKVSARSNTICRVSGCSGPRLASTPVKRFRLRWPVQLDERLGPGRGDNAAARHPRNRGAAHDPAERSSTAVRRLPSAQAVRASWTGC